MRLRILAAQVVMIVTTITAKEVELLQKVNPDALSLKDEKGNDTFKVSVASGSPTINTYGLTVHPTMDIVILKERPVDVEAIKVDMFVALNQLGKLEAQVAKAIEAFGDADIPVEEIA